MNFYALRFSLASGLNQSDVLAKVKTGGGDGVQTADGLYIATELDAGALAAQLGTAVSIVPDPAERTPDMETFRAKY